MEHGKAAVIYTAICTKDWIMRGPADREWLKIKKDNEKYKICRNSDITMLLDYVDFLILMMAKVIHGRIRHTKIFILAAILSQDMSKMLVFIIRIPKAKK